MRKSLIILVIMSLTLLLAACSQPNTKVLDVNTENKDTMVEDTTTTEDTTSSKDTTTTEDTTSSKDTTTTEDTTSSEEVSASESGNQSSSQPSDGDLQDYVDVDFVDLDGNTVSISDYEGKFIALNFFGTWCKYCMEELPEYEKVYSEYQGDDFVILLVNATTTEKNGEDTVREWYANQEITMPMVLDLDGKGMSVYPVQGFPTTYFISKEGKVLGGIPGMVDEATLLKILETYNPKE